ncbi:pseudouridine synthase [Sphingobium subterraneum]|uniref:Pseudouridine synthase n=1 Tax=Sphingobium subterraneum TaxID=627688 RepID=A0A841IZT4_9SPHN|nr:pseudouridine synthase [Sphingobium subterraneum]MBB6124479.1 23S rRNA pseudouridine2605 synthase [Sphingobium subterraneum]
MPPPRKPRKPFGKPDDRRPAREDGKRPSRAKSEDQKASDAWGVAMARPVRKAPDNKAKGNTPNGERARGRTAAGGAKPPLEGRRPQGSAAAMGERPPRMVRKPRAHAPQKPVTNPHPARAGAVSGEGPQRIAKLLARAGVASRREVERMIAEGRVALAGALIDTPATLLSSLAGVTVDGNLVAEPEEARLFLFHKPPGYLTTERDPAGRPTIYDRLPADLPRVMPVGRLDMNTEGLLLLTTDGGLKRQMELPSTGVERSYRARAFGEVSQTQLEELMMGVEVEGIRYGRIDANLERRTGRNQWIEMTLTEGKNREVRRVLEHLGLKVNRLIRTRYGIFELGDLPPGAVVEVRQHELELFRKSLKQRGD